MTNIKKAPRKKAYKFMSVSELVAARKELVIKMEQIDSILNEAVEAVTSIRPMSNRSMPNAMPLQRGGGDPAFAERGGAQQAAYLNAQVAVNKEAPILPNLPSNAPNQSSGFSIFDAESDARMKADQELDYASANNVDISTAESSFDFDSDAITKEIEELKNGISEGLKNVSDSETIS